MPTSAWATIKGKATTAETHACVIHAEFAVTNPDDLPGRVAAYREVRDSRHYVDLNRLPLSAGHLAELAIVVEAGVAGVRAQRVDGTMLRTLVRLSLVHAVPRDGRPADPLDWRSTLRATLRGRAVILGAQGKPVKLTTAEAMPLAVIETAMLKDPVNGGVQVWPGSGKTLRIALMWRLVEHVRVAAPPSQRPLGAPGPAVYRLTPEGISALDRQREGDHGSGQPTDNHAEVLERVARAEPVGDVDHAGLHDGAVEGCIVNGWVKWGSPVKGTRRISLHITENGREALAAHQFRANGRAAVPDTQKVFAPQVRIGQHVRLTNRARRRGTSTGGWVRVVDVQNAGTLTQQGLPHNYEIWVVTDDRPDPFLYGDTPHFRSVKFEVRSL